MADQKISQLDELTDLDVADVFPVVDVSANTTKKLTFDTIRDNVLGDLDNLEVFESRSDAEAANIDTSVDHILVGGLFYVRDSAGTALVSADGAQWSPDLVAHNNTVYFEHFADNTA